MQSVETPENSSSLVLAESVAEDAAIERPNPAASATNRSDAFLHASMLVVALLVVVLSVVLRVPGEEKVCLPGVDVPLPGLCASREYLGLDCPGCGMTRCFISLAHGQLARAWHFNPAGFLLFPIILGQIPYRAYQIYRVRRGRPTFRSSKLTWLLWLFVAAMLLQWIVKMGGQLL